MTNISERINSTSTCRREEMFTPLSNLTTTKTQDVSRILQPLFLVTMFLGVVGEGSKPFPTLFSVKTLDGKNGFVFAGENMGDRLGDALSGVGDINGDGLPDLAIGVPKASVGQLVNVGKTYVLFGRRNPQIRKEFNRAKLDGALGFEIIGEGTDDGSGYSVARAGDVNADGVEDMLIGAENAQIGSIASVGKAYVIFGRKGLGQEGRFDLSTLNGLNGFVINGQKGGDSFGWSVVGAGDVNGDRIDDILIGAPGADPDGKAVGGKTYLIYGRRGVVSNGVLNLASLNPFNGVVIKGESTADHSGRAVAGPGDLNCDGYADLVIGARNADYAGTAQVGKTYVIFGGKSIGNQEVIELSKLSYPEGFTLIGETFGDGSGTAVSGLGDVNQDGFMDFMIGAHSAASKAGKAYLVFGSKLLGSSGSVRLSQLMSPNGVRFGGKRSGNFFGTSMSAAGDLNGDGIDDFLIGAVGVRVNSISSAGETYLIYGDSNLNRSSTFTLNGINGFNGFVFQGEGNNDRLGTSMSTIGDWNGDGLDDIIIGADTAYKSAGKAYVIFGRDQTSTTTSTISTVSQFNPTPFLLQNRFTQQTQLSSKESVLSGTPNLPSWITFSTSPSTNLTDRFDISDNILTDYTDLILGIILPIIICMGCLAISGHIYFKTKSKKKRSIQVNPSEQQKTTYEYSAPPLNIIESSEYTHMTSTEKHYKDWPKHPPEHDASHYTSMQSINKDHDQYQNRKRGVDAKPFGSIVDF